MLRIQILLGLLLCISAVGCKSEGPAKQTENGALKSYVRPGLDAAEGASNKLEKRDDEARKALHETMDY